MYQGKTETRSKWPNSREYLGQSGLLVFLHNIRKESIPLLPYATYRIIFYHVIGGSRREHKRCAHTLRPNVLFFLFIMMKIGQKLNWSPQFEKSWIHHSNITLQTDVKLYLLNVVYCVILLNKPFITSNCFSLFVMISQLIIILWNVIFYLLNSIYLMVK